MSHPTQELIDIRAGETGDLPFIFSSWLKSLRYGNSWFEKIDQDIYFAQYHKVIETILAKPTTVVRVACLKEDSDVILGYSIAEPLTEEESILHWVFVKPDWRKIGIGKMLMPVPVKKVTHLTLIGKALMKNGIIFDPFAI